MSLIFQVIMPFFFQFLISFPRRANARRNVRRSARGAAPNAPSIPKQEERTNARGIRKNTCRERETTNAFLGLPMAWKKEEVTFGRPNTKNPAIYRRKQ